jgi:hypothetical protein
MSDLIDRQMAINEIANNKEMYAQDRITAVGILDRLPIAQHIAQQEIIRCNACIHWHQTTGDMEGFGLGDCDYLEKKLVSCNGYCYWAERRTDNGLQSWRQIYHRN